MDHLPGAVVPPRPTVMVHGLPGGQIMGQHPPRTATTEDGKDAESVKI